MLEAYRRQTAHYLDLLNETMAEAAQALVDAGAYPAMDDLLADYASYLTGLFATVAAIDGDVSPDEMVVMLFQGLERYASGDDYLAAVRNLRLQALRGPEELVEIPRFLEAAAACDARFGTTLAADLVEALLGMAESVAGADFRTHPAELRFLDGYAALLQGFLRERGLTPADDTPADGSALHA
jgi:hypothetical protein